jgi:hypothetical protein
MPHRGPYSSVSLAFYDELMKHRKLNALSIELDWRFGLLERLGEVRMKELMDFHDQAEETFRRAMKAWRKEASQFRAQYEYADDDHSIEQRGSILSPCWTMAIRSASSACTRSSIVS